MRILFISSSNVMAAHLSYLMTLEGHEVKLFIDDKDRKDDFDNLVEKSLDWKNDLSWVGKGENSLVVFDDIGYGRIQDKLRKEGYSVFGGSALADKLESNRQYAHEVFAAAGMKTVPIKDFKDLDQAIDFVKSNPKSWVIKQNGSASKSLNYVGHFEDGRDVIDMLEDYKKNLKGKIGTITLQEKIHGVEIGVGRYFNGLDWVGPMEINIEHKKFFPGDIGPSTSEMGTLAWYDDNENNKLFRETLSKLKPHLQKINFKGDIEINSIVNETGSYPLEATPRFGSPIVYLHSEIHESPWGDFLKALADGKNYDLKWKKGYGLVVLLAVAPFPYAKKLKEVSHKGLEIYFSERLNEEDFKHIQFEGVAVKKESGENRYYISDNQGYVLYVTAIRESVELAREEIDRLVSEIYIPKVFYRNDIGLSFANESREQLIKLGYII